MDLRDKVTVFLISVGASSYPRAKRALQEQDCQFTLEEIRFVSPMSAAFQAMIDRCKTPFFIQCDEDMICKKHAVRSMYEGITSSEHVYYQEHGWSPEKCAMVCYPVWDAHLERSRLGIKIYQHAAMKQAPYRDVQSCEVDQIARLKEKGYHIRIDWGREWNEHKGRLEATDKTIMALHGTSYTPREAFNTYLDMAQKCRDVGGNDWFRDHPQKFFERMTEGNRRADLSGSDLWALLGVTAGFTSPKETREDRGEKNFNDYYTDPKFGEMRTMLVDPPKRLDVYTTSKCNLACDFCGRQRGGVDMDALQLAADVNLPGVVSKVLGYYPSISSACVAGFGEPLLCDSLGDTLHVLEGRFIGLITNGLALAETPLEWNRIGHLTVSLNAATAEEHLQRTGVAGAWDRVKAGLHMLHMIKVPFTLSFVVGRQEWPRIPEYLQTAADMKAESVYFVNLLPHHDEGADDQWFQTNVIKDVGQGHYRQLEAYKQKARALGVNVEVWPQPISTAVKPRNCTGPWTAIGVDSRGYYGGCPRVTGPGPRWGHVDEGRDFWTKSGTLMKLRRELSGADVALRYTCQNCFGCWQHY